MAELTAAETTTNSCCAPEQQATCCEPSAKDDCCGHGDDCDCDANQSDRRARAGMRALAAATKVTGLLPTYPTNRPPPQGTVAD
jgi:hypothetical protein